MQNGRKSFAKTAVRAATGREVADVLRELYVDGRHSDREIAEWLAAKHEIEVDRSLIQAWRREYGITRDDRAGVSL
jgi:phosphohistidine phosphatase SixA